MVNGYPLSAKRPDRMGEGGMREVSSTPTPRVFFAKSVESLENKRVEFCASAKKCKRVRKSMKTKDGTVVGSEEWLLGFARSELVPTTWERGYPPWR